MKTINVLAKVNGDDLRLAHEKGITIPFVDEAYKQTYAVQITELKKEDGSGYTFNIKGIICQTGQFFRFVGKKMEIKNSITTKNAVELFYNTRTNKGTFRLP
jgi:hypothetical protein